MIGNYPQSLTGHTATVGSNQKEKNKDINMKNEILAAVNRAGDIALTAFKHHVPEAAGEYDFIFPAKGIENSNILLIGRVSEEFINTMNELITNQVLTFEPCSFFVVTADGGEIYDIPLVKTNKLSYKTLHWLPILIKRGKNFPKLKPKANEYSE